jgi:hypothetical protein
MGLNRKDEEGRGYGRLHDDWDDRDHEYEVCFSLHRD